MYNYRSTVKNYTGGCFRLGMRSVQPPDGMSNFTSSLLRMVNGEDFISEMLLASSKIFPLLFSDSTSARREEIM